MGQRFDLLFTAEDPRRRVAPGAAVALLRHLSTLRIVLPDDEAVAETWTEVYCKPGPSAHEPFVTGAYDGKRPVFKEMAIRFGTQSVRVRYDGLDVPVFFFVEFRGCLFEDVTGAFRRKFEELLYVKPALHVRPHRRLPRHRTVPPGERPRKPERKGRDGGRAGTTVEEW